MRMCLFSGFGHWGQLVSAVYCRPGIRVTVGTTSILQMRLSETARPVTDTFIPLRALADTPAFCRSRIRLRSWSFSHVPVLTLPVVSLILNATQERCLYIEIGSTTCLCVYILDNILSKHLTHYSVEKIESCNKKENTEL